MNKLLFCNIIIIILIIIGIILNKSDDDKKNYKDHSLSILYDKNLWFNIDIIIAIISLYIVFIYKKILYILIILGNIYMIYTESKFTNKIYGSEEHIRCLLKGFFVDGLIIGIVISTIYLQLNK